MEYARWGVCTYQGYEQSHRNAYPKCSDNSDKKWETYYVTQCDKASPPVGPCRLAIKMRLTPQTPVVEYIIVTSSSLRDVCDRHQEHDLVYPTSVAAQARKAPRTQSEVSDYTNPSNPLTFLTEISVVAPELQPLASLVQLQALSIRPGADAFPESVPRTPSLEKIPGAELVFLRVVYLTMSIGIRQSQYREKLGVFLEPRCRFPFHRPQNVGKRDARG